MDVRAEAIAHRPGRDGSLGWSLPNSNRQLAQHAIKAFISVPGSSSKNTGMHWPPTGLFPSNCLVLLGLLPLQATCLYFMRLFIQSHR